MKMLSPEPRADDLRIAVVRSTCHNWATEPMLQGAVERFIRLGGKEKNLIIASAPGSWELPAVCRALAEVRKFDALVAIGAVIRGETPHFDHICGAVSRGLMDVTTACRIPVGFGVLTCDTADQARARSGGSVGNKGAEAMTAAIESALMCRTIKDQLALPDS